MTAGPQWLLRFDRGVGAAADGFLYITGYKGHIFYFQLNMNKDKVAIKSMSLKSYGISLFIKITPKLLVFEKNYEKQQLCHDLFTINVISSSFPGLIKKLNGSQLGLPAIKVCLWFALLCTYMS